MSLDELKQAMMQHLKDDKVSFDAIQASLNAIDEKLDAHIEKVEPYLQGAAGFGILWKILIAVGGLLVMWSQVKGIFIK